MFDNTSNYETNYYNTLKRYFTFYFSYRFSLFCGQNYLSNTDKEMICVMFVCVVNQ